MRHIMVMNAKGGCGKSTLATNIASYFANEGATVALLTAALDLALAFVAAPFLAFVFAAVIAIFPAALVAPFRAAAPAGTAFLVFLMPKLITGMRSEKCSWEWTPSPSRMSAPI